MKNSDFIIRTQRMLPEVYSDESRDFQLFTKLMDAVFNSCKWNTASMQYISDPRHINTTLLKLLADKLGLDLTDANELKDDEVRIILQCLPYLIRYKGSYKAVEGLVNMYFKLYHIQGTYDLKITNTGAVVQGITLGGHTIILGMETISQSITLLKIMAKYLLPPGYSFFVYFYTKAENRSSFIYREDLQLLFSSNNINSMIDQEIPDFILNAKYYGKETLAGVDQIISALDAHQLLNAYNSNDNSIFLGFIKEDDISQICKNYKAATTYDKTLDPTITDHTTTTQDYTKYSVAIFENDTTTEYKILMPQYRFGKIVEETPQAEFLNWKVIKANSLVITDTESESNGVHSIGEIFIVTTTAKTCKFNKLTFRNSYKIIDYTNILSSLPDVSTMNEFDYCCLIDESEKPFWHVDSNTEVLLTQKDAVKELPYQCLVNDLRYSLDTEEYFRCYNSSLYDKNLLTPTNFRDSEIVNNVVYVTNKEKGIITADGVAYGESVFTIETEIEIKKDHIYLLTGCPNGGSSETYQLCIDSKLFDNKWLSDTGDGIIAKATEGSEAANIRIILQHGTEITNGKFIPELFDLTETLEITEEISITELLNKLWVLIKEGPALSGQKDNNEQLVDDSVVWRHQGDYYICRKTKNTNYWEKYTEPLFLLKLLQSRGKI